MKLIYDTRTSKSVILFVLVFMNNLLYAQLVEPPVLTITESNGVQFYTSNGFENGLQPIPFVPAVQPGIKSISDYTLEEINNMLIDLDTKLEQYQNDGDQESIDLLLALQVLLIEQKTILSN